MSDPTSALPSATLSSNTVLKSPAAASNVVNGQRNPTKNEDDVVTGEARAMYDWKALGKVNRIYSLISFVPFGGRNRRFGYRHPLVAIYVAFQRCSSTLWAAECACVRL